MPDLRVGGDPARLRDEAGDEVIAIDADPVVEEILVAPARERRPDLVAELAHLAAGAGLGVQPVHPDAPGFLLAAVLPDHLVDRLLQRSPEPEVVAMQRQHAAGFQRLEDPAGQDDGAAQQGVGVPVFRAFPPDHRRAVNHMEQVDVGGVPSAQVCFQRQHRHPVDGFLARCVLAAADLAVGEAQQLRR